MVCWRKRICNSLAAAQASAAPETTIQIRTLVTQPTRDDISELIDTVTTSYAVRILGTEDNPPLPAKADTVSVTVITPAQTDVAGDLLTESDTTADYTAPAGADQADEYITTTSSGSVSGGVASTINDGAPVITYHILSANYATLELAKASVNAGQTVSIITRSTQATLDVVSAIIETIITSYTIQINGVEDTPPLPAKADESNDTVLTAATSVAGTPIVTDSSESYSVAAADQADGFTEFTLSSDPNPGYGSSLTREENNVTPPAGSDVQYLTETYNLVTYQAAYSYDQTWTREVKVNGQPDATPPVGALSETRTVNIGELVSETSYGLTRQVDNPAYEAPAYSATGNIALGNKVFGGAVKVYDSAFALVSELTATQNPISGAWSVDVSFDAEGTYYLTFFDDAAHLADNIANSTPPTSVTVTANADGSVSVN